MWCKVGVSKTVRNEDGQNIFKIKDIYKVSCVKMLILGKVLGGPYLFVKM